MSFKNRMIMTWRMKKFFILFIIGYIYFIPGISFGAGGLVERLAGRILLQVESDGEAWYLSPGDNTRYFLGRPENAFEIMRDQGIGITNSNLNKIPIGLSDSAGPDSDFDGLTDLLEEAIGTNNLDADSDDDGFSDKDELTDGFNPKGPGELLFDEAFTSKQSGKIFLQVEARGETWYVSPTDNRRYFLGRPEDAFNIMRSLGLGISNSDLERIMARTPGYLLLEAEKDIYELINKERINQGLKPLAWNDDIAAAAREHSRNLARENKAFTGIGISCGYPIIHHEGNSFGLYNSNRLNNRGIYYFSRAGENIALMSGAVFRVKYKTNAEADREIEDCKDKRENLESAFNNAMDAEEDGNKKLKIVEEEIIKRTEVFSSEQAVNLVNTEWSEKGELMRQTARGWMDSPGHRQIILEEEFDETGIGAAYVEGYLIFTQVFIKRADCGFETGPCCEKEGYYPYCYIPLTCNQENICE